MTDVRELQGTIASFDADHRSGVVLLDDGVQMSFDRAALDDGVRLLRLGQRVRLVVHGSDTDVVVWALTIVTLRLTS